MSRNSDRPLSFLICGPKGAGKSTFAKLLVNSLLSQQQDSSRSSGVAFLDLDPGQPEFQPPGMIALSLIGSFITSAPFTHQVYSNSLDNRIVRSHFIGYLSPREDPFYYIRCCLDLFARYRSLSSARSIMDPSLPLVINCCGWILGTGLDILLDLICKIQPSHIIYMSMQGPEEVLSRLAALVSPTPMLLHTLASQPFLHTTQDASDLRLMQTLSYFHQATSPGQRFRWKSPPSFSRLTTLPYAGTRKLIHSILILGDEIHPNCVADLIENSLLGVVLIDDDKALMKMDRDLKITSDATYNPGSMALSEEIECANANFLPRRRAQPPTVATNCRPRIIHTHEHIPYISLEADGQSYLEPSKAQALGQVLIYGINQETCSFEASTPIPSKSFEQWRRLGLKVILVRGQLDVSALVCREQLTANSMKRFVFSHSTVNEERDHEAFIHQQGESRASSTYVLDTSMCNGSQTKAAPTISRARYRTKVWRSRKNLRYHESNTEFSDTKEV